jgi:hypothetical protein
VAEQHRIESRFVVADDFLEEEQARALRADIDTHFAAPERHGPDTHQIWNYWHVPGSYTYLRTQPEKVLKQEHVELFVTALRRWSINYLGLAGVSHPFLSLYIDGCQQVLHNDSLNGRFGYVFSLTRDRRKTSGGETLLLKEGDLFASRLSTAEAGVGLFDAVEPRFNRLVVFDDRVPHAVQRVEGSMDPREGRFVLHGHLTDTGSIVSGKLTRESVEPLVKEVAIDLLQDQRDEANLYHGLVVLRFVIAPSGAVESAWVLVDRLARRDGGRCAKLVDTLLERARALRFPAVEGRSGASVPLTFGGALPNA